MLLTYYGHKVTACWWCRLQLAVVIVWEVLQGFPLYFLRSGCGGSPHGLESGGFFFCYNFTVVGRVMPIVLDGALCIVVSLHLFFLNWIPSTYKRLWYYFGTWTWKGLWRTWARFVSRRHSSTESKCFQFLELFHVGKRDSDQQSKILLTQTRPHNTTPLYTIPYDSIL